MLDLAIPNLIAWAVCSSLLFWVALTWPRALMNYPLRVRGGLFIPFWAGWQVGVAPAHIEVFQRFRRRTAIACGVILAIAVAEAIYGEIRTRALEDLAAEEARQSEAWVAAMKHKALRRREDERNASGGMSNSAGGR